MGDLRWAAQPCLNFGNRQVDMAVALALFNLFQVVPPFFAF